MQSGQPVPFGCTGFHQLEATALALRTDTVFWCSMMLHRIRAKEQLAPSAVFRVVMCQGSKEFKRQKI